MSERKMTQGTLDYLRAQKSELEAEIRQRGNESSGHQRASIHDDAGAENALNLLRATLMRIGDLSDVDIIKPSKDTNLVNLGVKVRIQFEDGEEELTILSQDDVIHRKDIGQIVSPESPLGMAILGKKKGEIAEFQLSRTERAKVKILDIRCGDF